MERCVNSLLAGAYPNQEIVLVDTGSVTANRGRLICALASRPGVRLLHWDQPFNYAAVNNFAVRHVRGEVLTFLNDDTEVITPDWLDRLLKHACGPTCAAARAALFQRNVAARWNCPRPKKHHLRASVATRAGRRRRTILAVARNVSAVTGACLMMRRSVFDEVGGFDEQFAGDFNDVDLCLKARQRGYQVIWTPHARLFHHECQTRANWSTRPGMLYSRWSACSFSTAGARSWSAAILFTIRT